MYSSTEYAVRTLTQGLRIEEAENNIRATEIAPGSVATKLVNRISDPEIRQGTDAFYQIANSPEVIASSILHAIFYCCFGWVSCIGSGKYCGFSGERGSCKGSHRFQCRKSKYLDKL